MSVIYLLSSLPTLQLDAPAPITTEAFVAACRDQFSAADAAAAEALLTDAACDHPFVTTWRDRDTILRNAAAYQRARLPVPTLPAGCVPSRDVIHALATC